MAPILADQRSKTYPISKKNEDQEEHAEPMHVEPKITHDRKHCSYAGTEQQVVYGFAHLIHHAAINGHASWLGVSIV